MFLPREKTAGMTENVGKAIFAFKRFLKNQILNFECLRKQK